MEGANPRGGAAPDRSCLGHAGPRGRSFMPHDLADCRRLLGLALLVGLLLGAGAAAQGTKLDDVPAHYFNVDQFEIPFAMNPGRNVRQVILWASTDGQNFDAAATSR